MNRLQRAYLLLVELGPGQLLDYARYRAQLSSGRIQKLTPLNASTQAPIAPDITDLQLFRAMPATDPEFTAQILKQADEIVAGRYAAFGGELVPLSFELPEKDLQHWSVYGDTLAGQDIKTIWEPARFGWALPLCQAYLLTQDEKYPRCFWHNFAQFTAHNPVNAGPNWASGQEVALRLIPWLAAAQVFAQSPESTAEHKQQLFQSLWQHACRIPVTLAYARSQNNNHYLSEALGLMLAGYVFHGTPQGKSWLHKGFNAFEEGICTQVEKDGTYSQHSNNYHRMMLHLSLLFLRLCTLSDFQPSPIVLQRLAQATRWLIAQYDMVSGQVPNLGHNDGSNLLPLGNNEYVDYRPALQAASLAFLGNKFLSAGPWDELARWLELPEKPSSLSLGAETNPAIRKIGEGNTWGTLRSVRFHSRPAHADLLHVDLWWQGENIACDAGTYAYNLPQPWQNALAKTRVHNTVCVAGQDQMIWAGKFLWLQRAEAQAFPPRPNEETAILYCNLPTAYTQVRRLKYLPGTGFEVFDTLELTKTSKQPVPVTLQWLLPDWPWQWQGEILHLQYHNRVITLSLSATEIQGQNPIHPFSVSLIRAGEALVGTDHDPLRGWVSPTYLKKIPALSLALTFEAKKTVELRSLWTLSKIE